MAYTDQDNSREKAYSGAIAVAIVGAVGYALVSGLAVSIFKEPPGFIPGTAYRSPPPPPPPHPVPQSRKTSSPRPSGPAPIVPVTPHVDQTVIDLGTTPTVIDIGTGGGTGTGSTPTFPPQPPAVDHSSRALPRGNPGDWVTTDAYPPSAIRAGLEGRTGFRLDVGSNGRATGCTIVSSSGADQLDRTACRVLMSKARFTPAKDGDGNPTASTYAGAVTWKLPAE